MRQAVPNFPMSLMRLRNCPYEIRSRQFRIVSMPVLHLKNSNQLPQKAIHLKSMSESEIPGEKTPLDTMIVKANAVIASMNQVNDKYAREPSGVRLEAREKIQLQLDWNALIDELVKVCIAIFHEQGGQAALRIINNLIHDINREPIGGDRYGQMGMLPNGKAATATLVTGFQVLQRVLMNMEKK